MSGTFKLLGQATEKRGPAAAGETVALGKLEYARTGDTLSAGKQAHAAAGRRSKPHAAVLAIAVSAKERKDDVKLGQALHKLVDEDPSIHLVHNPETHEVVMWGQGEMHLRVAAERLAGRSASPSAPAGPVGRLQRDHQEGRQRSAAGTRSSPAATASSATWCSTSSRCRAARASSSRTRSPAAWCRGTTSPRSRRASINALKHGPLGFPVVDMAVALVDGSYHTVDSSDMAFRTAARIGIVEGLPQCQPVLLEPIHLVEIVCPTDATAKINAILSGRRGQILGFDTREGWDGWDVVRAKMPEAEIGDLIIEVRSATAGVGTFTFKFDHMAELTGKTADQIVAARRRRAAGVRLVSRMAQRGAKAAPQTAGPGCRSASNRRLASSGASFATARETRARVAYAQLSTALRSVTCL